MLTIHALSNPLQKLELLKCYDPQKTSWIVSELRTKFEIQHLILQRQPYFEDSSVLRASELWKWIHRRARPDCRLVSRDFLLSWVQNELKKESTVLPQNADVVLLSFMDHIAPILTHPLGFEQLEDWLAEHPESKLAWGSWLNLGQKMMTEMNRLQILPSTWIASSLQNILNISDYWDRPLVIDLSSQLSRVEADLLFQLSRQSDVQILEPTPAWRGEYSYLMSSYQLLRELNRENPVLSAATEKLCKFELRRLTGPLAEAKFCTEKVRNWLEDGVLAKDIAIVAPEIEEYWPLLEPYFCEEGISASKDKVTRLQILPSVAKWLANIRLYAGKVQFSDLELSYFSRNESSNFRFEKFNALFSQLISEEDLGRHESIRQAFAREFHPNSELGRDEWIGFALRYWPLEGDQAWLETVLRDLLSPTLDSMKLKLSTWVFYLEQLCAKREVRVRPSVPGGVQFLNLSSIETIHFQKLIFLGLTESQLKDKYRGLLSSEEVARLKADLGFHLDHPEVSSREFDLAWAHENDLAERIYCYPETNFSGASEAASRFWLRLAGKDKVPITIPQNTRWNSIENADLVKTLSQIRPLSQSFVEAQTKILQKDLSQELTAVLKYSDYRLSISAVEEYTHCPFLFAAKRIFHLKDEAIVDLEADGRNLGVLEHALFENLCQVPRRFDWSETEICTLLESIRQEKQIHFFDENVWLSIRQKYCNRALRFLEAEQEWQNLYPETKTVAREKAVKFFVDPETGDINRQQGIEFSGKIDRIDSDGSELAILDYKMSTSSLTGINSALGKNQLQLLFYSMALDSGVDEELNGQSVAGAFYYDVKKRERAKGLRLRTARGSLFPLQGGSRNLITEDEKSAFYVSLKAKLVDVLQSIQSGHFPAKPEDKKNCPSCEWRNLCRAPHLK